MTPRLSRTWLANQGRGASLPPVKVLQFGDGNFLLGFFDWMLQRLNHSGLFSGSALVVRPNRPGTTLARDLTRQDGLYTMVLRGREKGAAVDSREVIESIAGCINPYEEWDRFQAAARLPELRFVVSNTTEAGIAYQAAPHPEAAVPESFPAKAAALLLERFASHRGDETKGLVFLPCELIENAGGRLRDIVLRHLGDWGEEAAAPWVKSACLFCDTLVDRIVTGQPKEELESFWSDLGYRDDFLCVGEPYHFWAIQGPKDLEQELPLAAAGLNVVVSENIKPYRDRKVRVLNGAHTGNVLAAFLAGLDTVGEMLDDPLFGRGLKRMLDEEILPGLSALPEAERRSFADAVLERFRNPYTRHELIAISLNSVSKWKARILPSVRDYTARTGGAPRLMAFSLAALIRFYQTTADGVGGFVGRREKGSYPVRDDMAIMAAFTAAWHASAGDPARAAALIMADAGIWGEDLSLLPGFAAAVAGSLVMISGKGVREALAAVL